MVKGPNTNNTRSRYAEKLLDNRWLKKRLEILDRDSHTCRYCKSGDGGLQVHHLKYTGEPWEAPNKDLITVCSFCHLVLENLKTGWDSYARVISIERLDHADPKGKSAQRTVLIESRSGVRLVLFFKFDIAGEISLRYWTELHDLSEVIRKFKTNKSSISNGERPGNSMVLE